MFTNSKQLCPTCKVTSMCNTFVENFNPFPNRIIHKFPCDWKQQFYNGNVTATLNIAFTTMKTVITDAHKCLVWWINAEKGEKEVCVGVCVEWEWRVPYKHKSKQMAMTEACWGKFDFLHPGTSLLPAVTYTSIGQNNEDSKASRKKRKNQEWLYCYYFGDENKRK